MYGQQTQGNLTGVAKINIDEIRKQQASFPPERQMTIVDDLNQRLNAMNEYVQAQINNLGNFFDRVGMSDPSVPNGQNIPPPPVTGFMATEKALAELDDKINLLGNALSKLNRIA